MNEIEKLVTLLTAAHIPFQVVNHWQNTLAVCYPQKEGQICDVICFSGSYGYDEGLLEIMGLVNEAKVGDTVEGFLDAQEVFDRISKDWETRRTEIDINLNAKI